MNLELHDAWERFRDDDEAFVLVITGAGDTTFCAGWDLADAAALTSSPTTRSSGASLQRSGGRVATPAASTSSSR